MTSNGYDRAGNRLTKQDPGGNCSASPPTGCTSFTYDAANQLKTVSYSDGVTPNVTNLTYDSDGQRIAMSDGTGTSTWVWDSLHRLASYTNGVGAQVQYAYNLRSLPTTIRYPGTLNVTRGYDNAGRLTSVQDWLSNTTTFGYDVNSNLTTETLPAASGVVDTFTYDAADRLTGISDVKGGLLSLFSATYSRDNANQLTADSSAPTTTGSYRYNPLNQLCYAGASSATACSLPPPAATAYAFDAADNLTQMGGTQQAFNAADELCWTASSSGSCASQPSGATTYTYDARGNRTRVTPPSGGATNLSYDQANRLTAYGSAATYAYNGDGLRMSKTVSGTTSQFLWDMAQTLSLLLKDGSTAYIYGPAGMPLEQVNGSAPMWLHHDQLGSTRLITNTLGANQATFTFDAYGNLTTATGTVTNPIRFAGQYADSESGLYYLRARYYDAGTGQFLSRDPVVSATREPFAYSANSPLNLTDPTGLYNCGWQFWNCVSRPKNFSEARNRLSTNAKDPQALGIAITAGWVAGAVCLVACEAIPLAAAGKAVISVVGGVAVSIHVAAEIGMTVFDSWSSPTRDATDSNPDHQESRSLSPPIPCKSSQPGPTEPSFDAPPSDVIRAP